MLCVPIQVELTEEDDDPAGTVYVAVGGFVTGTYPRSGPSLYRPYLLCVGEGDKLRLIPLDKLKFVAVMPQYVFVGEGPQGTGIVAGSASGGIRGAS